MKMPGRWRKKENIPGQLPDNTLADLSKLKKEIKAIKKKRNINETRKHLEKWKKTDMEEKNNQQISSEENNKNNQSVSMVPLISWQTVFVVAIGAFIGVLLSFGYWFISPSLTSTESTSPLGEPEPQSTGLLGLLGMTPDGPYSSKVNIQIVSPGSEYIPLKSLQQMAEYFNAKINSLPFLKFLDKQLNEKIAGSNYDVTTLDQMISTEYNPAGEIPFITVKVIAETENEALSLAELVPQYFLDYLIYDNNEQTQKKYSSTLSEINSLKITLYNAQIELDHLQPVDILENPAYISLNAKVNALQEALNNQAKQLTVQKTSQADLQAEYDDTIQQMKVIKQQIDEANQEMQTFLISSGTNPADNESTILILEAKIKALETELDKMMTGYTETIDTVQVSVPGLAEMIANGDTTSVQYLNTLKKVETISQALADAKKILRDLEDISSQNLTAADTEYQIVQIKIDVLNAQKSALNTKLSQIYQQLLTSGGTDNQTSDQILFNNISIALAEAKKELSSLEEQLGYDSLSSDLDLQIAQEKVTNLNNKLGDLTEQLGSLTGVNNATLETDYLVAGNPSVPYTILPERGRAFSTLLMGAFAGVIIGWAILNRRWILKVAASVISTGNSGENDDQE